MKIVLMSMPDVAAVIMHETAFHMPNNGIASIGANIDEGHEVYHHRPDPKAAPGEALRDPDAAENPAGRGRPVGHGLAV